MVRFIVGFLLVLFANQTTGFSVKLLGNGNAFGEGHAEALNDGTKVPIGDDVFPDPNEQSHNREKVPSTDELYLENLRAVKPMTNVEIDDYLMRYGYLFPPANGTITDKERADALREYQRFSRLRQTGIVDSQTLRQMQRSRCGISDPVSNNRIANFAAKGSRKWKNKDLTYKIVTFSKKLPEETVRQSIAKAFKMWSDVTQLTFTEVSKDKESDLRLSFTARKHGDGFPFDGKGGVLAHAFFPSSGEIHMEEEEKWTVNTNRGTDLLFVLVHEIGHALGLGHSSVDGAVMEAYYNGYVPNLKLHKDDVAGIQFLYGMPNLHPQTPKPPTKAPTTEAPTTDAPKTKAPTTNVPQTKASTTNVPQTTAPTTNAKTTNAPDTKAPTTNVPAPATTYPTTKASNQTHPTYKTPNYTYPATKAPNHTYPATNAPNHTYPTTKTWNYTRLATKAWNHTHPTYNTPNSTYPTTKTWNQTHPTPNHTYPAYTTETPYYPSTESPTKAPTPPPRKFPCPYRFWATMTIRNRTFGFFRRNIHEILPNGRPDRAKPIRYVFPHGPRIVGAAAHDDMTGRTFLFLGRWVWRFTNHILDRGFPKRVHTFIRAAVVVDGQLIAFSFTHVHYLDENTLQDYVDGEVRIQDEYPDLPFGIRSAVSYGNGMAHVLYTRKVYKLDMYTGESKNVTSCYGRYF